MNTKILFLFTLLFYGVCYSADYTTDNVIIHRMKEANNSSSSGLGFPSPIEIFDNFELTGQSSFIVTPDSIIDRRGIHSAEFKYSKFYRFNPLVESEDDMSKVFPSEKMPFDFIKVDPPFIFLSIAEYRSGIASVEQSLKRYYFKLDPGQYKGGSNGNIIWKTEITLNSIKRLESEDKDFAQILNSFRNCIRKKDLECLVQLEPNFKRGVEEWSILSDQKLCSVFQIDKQFSEDLKHKIKEQRVPWSLYQDLFSLSNSRTNVRYVHENFDESKEVQLILNGDSACGRNSTVDITFLKEKMSKKWKIIINVTVTDG